MELRYPLLIFYVFEHIDLFKNFTEGNHVRKNIDVVKVLTTDTATHTDVH